MCIHKWEFYVWFRFRIVICKTKKTKLFYNSVPASYKRVSTLYFKPMIQEKATTSKAKEDFNEVH